MMTTFYYESIETVPEAEGGDNRISWKYLLRQIIICSGISVANFSYGLTLGSPTVFIPQLRQEANSSDAVSTAMASWLSSTINYSGIVNAIILAILARLAGRKLPFLYICITSLIGSIIFYYSTNITQILISQILYGPLAGSPLTILTMVLTEYMSPRYRGIFLTFKSAIFLWGIWVANTIGTFTHWKTIGIVAFICSMYSLLTVIVWPESPYWLVNKNRFEECALSHQWLKGYSRESEAELKILIETRKVTLSSKPVKHLNAFKSFTKMFRSKIFYKPISLSLLVLSLYHFSGKLACVMYSIDIIKRITGTTSTAYTGMLILDGITVLGAYVGCGLSKFLKRRTLLLTSSTIGVIFLLLISFYLYLIHFEVISENPIVSLLLLMVYSLTISAGPMIMSGTILSELIPLKYRSSSVLLLGGYTNFLMATVVNISPFILDYFGTRGLFIFFAVISSSLIIITNKVLPETKDKTILQIQECLLGTNTSIKPIISLKEGN